MTTEVPQPRPSLPDENLTESSDPALLQARASLLSAQAALLKAKVPLLDKIILRGLLPIALAVVGPWALMKFDKAQIEQEKQGAVIVELQKLLEDAKIEGAARQSRDAAWRERMKSLEEEKAEELAVMSAMVLRLDNMLKTALVQMAVARVMGSEAPSGAPSRPTRNDVIRDAAAQIELPGIDPGEVERIAGQQYDRMMEQRTRR